MISIWFRQIVRLTLAVILVCTGLLLSMCVAQQTALPANPVFHDIRGQVLGLDGKPAAGRVVSLVGISRRTQRPYDASDKSKNWRFITDSEGRFVARIGEFDSPRILDSYEKPGYGTYAVVVDGTEKDAGAVSPLYFLSDRHTAGDEERRNEWGQVVDLPLQGVDLTLHIKEGVTLSGRVWDAENPGQPLAGITVYTMSDLGSESHSGRGGEILIRKAITDAKGDFIIKQIYPSKFYIGMGAKYASLRDDNGLFWIETKYEGKWEEGLRDEITLKAGEKEICMEMKVAKNPIFVYSGKITDEEGKPIEGAGISFGFSYHPNWKNMEDNRILKGFFTGENGEYTITMGTPWARGLVVEAEGYEKQEAWKDDGTRTYTPLAPGKRDFVMRRKGGK